MGMEVEDDLFFADISKQISLLIMDEDEDPVATCPPVSFQDFSRGDYPIRAPHPFLYEQSCRRESKGTGVFIPQSTQPRRKYRQGRFNSFNSKSQRQNGRNKNVSQVSYNDYSFNPKNNNG